MLFFLFFIFNKNNDIRINLIKPNIDKVQGNSKCRMCGERWDSCIITKYSKLAHKEYKKAQLGGKGDPIGTYWPMISIYKLESI